MYGKLADVNECLVDNGGCEQDCNNRIGDFYCSCRDGYHMGSDQVTCLDVNECEDGNNGGCEQNCVNLIGSYFCSCRSGFRELNDTHCQG